MKNSEVNKGLLMIILYDQSQMSLFTEKLSGYGFDQILSCEDGAAALEKLHAGDQTVVITDTSLKGNMDGIDLGARIMEKYQLPVIYISELQDENTIQRALETRPAAFLTKPVNWAELRIAIESASYHLQEKYRLIESLENQFMIFEEAPIPCHILDTEGMLIAVNKEWSDLMRYKPGEVIGKSFNDFIKAESIYDFNQYFISLLQNKSNQPQEFDIIRKDGRILTAIISGNRHTDIHGVTISVHFILQDITEKKLLQVKLEESEERFRLLFEEAPLGYQSLAENGKILYVNDTWCRMLGYTKEETEGVWFGNFLVHEDQERFRDNFSLFRKKGEAYNIEYRMVRKNGSVIYVTIDGKVRYDENGNYIQSHCIVKDITEQKNAENALRESEKKFKSLIESAGDIIYILDDNLQYLYGNSQFLKRRGVTQEELVGRKYTDFHSDESSIEFNKKIQETYASGMPVTYEYQSDVDGRYFLRSISPVIDPQTKKFDSILVISRDITELKNAEQALHKRETEIRTITNNIPALISYVDEKGYYRFVNQQYEKWFGLPVGVITGKHYQEVLGEYAGIQIKDHIEKVLSGSHVTYEEEIDYINAGKKWVYAEYIPDINTEGRVTGFFALVTDISGRRKIEEELQVSRQMLQTILDTIPVAVFWKDTNSLYLGANRTFLDTVGMSSLEEIVGKNDYDLPWNKEQSDSFRIYDKRIIDSGVPEYNFIEPYGGKDGKRAWARTNKVPLRDKKGNITGILGTFEDITGLRQAEEALQIERQRFHDVLEVMPVMVCLLSPDYHVKFANRAFREKFGESNGRHCFEYCFNETEPCSFCESFQALKTGKLHRWEVAGVDGATTLDVHDFPYTDVDGSSMILEVSIDITERKGMEKALAESETMLRSIYENVNDIIWRIDAKTKITYMSPSVESILGYKPSEVLGLPILHFIAPDYQASASNNIPKRITNKKKNKLIYYEYEMVAKDGRKIPIEVSSTAIYDEKGTLTGFAGVTRDISKRKVIENALVESEARYRDLVEKAEVAVMTDDINGKITYCNREFAKLFGYTMSEIRKQTRETLINSEDLVKVNNYHEQRMTGNKAPGRHEIKGKRKGGEELWVEVKSTILNDQDKIIGTRNYFWDITERKNILNALTNSETRFRELFSRMTSGVAIIEGRNRNRDYIIKDINKAGLEIFKEKKKKILIGKNIAALFPGNQEMDVNKIIDRVVKSGKPDKLKTLPYKNQYPESYIDLYIYKLPTGEIIIVFDDITDRINDQLALYHNIEEIKKLSRHLETVREEERKIIARNLHDDLGQIMTAVKMDVSWIKTRLPEDNKGLKRRTESTLQIIDQAIGSVRRLSSELRPSILDDLGLYEALIAHIYEYEKHYDIRVNYKLPKKEVGLSAIQEISIFRIIQEAMTNAARHSRASQVNLHISKKHDNLEIFIGDNGKGIDESQITSSDSFGLIGMRERVLQWGGAISIKGIEQKGTHINIKIPLSEPVKKQ